MKYWIHTLIIIVLGFLLQSFLPWWILLLIAAVSALIINQRLFIMALFGFLGGMILWGGYSFYIDLENGQILSSRIGELLGGVSGNILVVITALLGGIIAAVGSYFGGSVRKIFLKNES